MSSNTTRLFALFALIVAIGSVFMYFKTVNEMGVLEIELGSLESEVSKHLSQISYLESDIDEKENEIDDLNSDYQVLDDQYNILSDDFDDLSSRYDVLESDYDELNTDYNTLSIGFQELDYIFTMNTELRIGNSLTSYYDYLRNEFGPTGSRSYWGYEEESCKFASSLALHDLHRLYWIEAEENYGVDVGQESYAQAWEVLSKAVEYCEIDDNDTDTEKIEKVLDFVYGLVEYELEIDDSLRAPVETLSLKSGDCDDFSILVAALLEAVDIQTGIGFFESEDSAHAMVLVHLDELEGYRYWFYEDLTNYDFESGTWLKIEPQFTIDRQGDDEWFSQWNIYMAVELDFDKVVS